MSRSCRWLRSSTPSAPSDLSPDSRAAAALRANLVADLSRRLFGKRLLLAIPVVAAAALSEQTEDAQAAPPPTPLPWTLTGNNNVTSDGSNFLGTQNNAPLIFKTNSTAGGGERMRITSDGNVGIGVIGPSAKLSVQSESFIGVRGTSSSNVGVVGESSSLSGVVGTSSSWYGVVGFSSFGTGVRGESPSSIGVEGVSSSSIGVSGTSSSAEGVHGASSSWYGVIGTSSEGPGGVYGESSHGVGVQGHSEPYFGVYGSSSASAGVFGFSPSYAGVYAITFSGDAVRGECTESSGYAGYFDGQVAITGNLSKGGGSFKIDHPLDQENKYLYHSFVESPDMMNVYNGNVTLSADGTATVELPDWFEALNKDFRYQLTAIGAPGPNLYIATKIKDNRFSIAGGMPGLEVSWQVTGIRKDAYAEAHRIPVEEDKAGKERGKYLYPKEHGQPEERGVDYEQRRAAQAALNARTRPESSPVPVAPANP
jgi:hypothetical protein